MRRVMQNNSPSNPLAPLGCWTIRWLCQCGYVLAEGTPLAFIGGQPYGCARCRRVTYLTVKIQ